MSLMFTGCKAPSVVQKTAKPNVPASYNHSQDTSNSALIDWEEYFSDPNLVAMIDTALNNNQELNIILQELEIAKNEVRARKGEYLPFVDLKAGAETEKVGRYTSQGSNDANTEIKPGREFPEPLPDFLVGAFANWEVDIWHKLRKKICRCRILGHHRGEKLYGDQLGCRDRQFLL